jgi:AraC-like DNA-binding protein
MSQANSEHHAMEVTEPGSWLSAPDPLGVLLDQLHIQCVVRREYHLPAESLIESPPGEPGFHLVLAGACIAASEGESVRLSAGEMVFIPQGIGHRLQTASSKTSEVSEDSGDLGWGASLVSGRILFLDDEPPPLHALLPPLLPVRSAMEQDALTARLLDCTARETQAPANGARTIVNHLLSLVYLQAVRTQVQSSDPIRPGWWRALRDAEIGPILAAMLRHPDRFWTVESLAAFGEMARSTFARRFRDVTGEAPIDVLTGVRMRVACRLLRHSQLGIKEISRRAGYRSVSAFSVAFRRWSGVSPLEYRNERRASTEVASKL